MNDQTIEVTYYLDVTLGNTRGEKQKNTVLEFKFSPCFECYMLCFG